ncbi:BgTH12-04385 [Blumeria graminis f. sp. triticale]|uniref:BgTH12-04385 n=1 Tax=Blumeria graminis f. sp. triticale TaxID=1689686 RepID=A0A9W4CUI1_BLUGR|nr:BgTH12-04385 [Blumeria graminis f. sp. triticale]
MAALQPHPDKKIPARKKIITYGKVTRKRISCNAFHSNSQEPDKKKDEYVRTESPTYTNEYSLEASPKIRACKDVYDVSSDDNDDDNEHTSLSRHGSTTRKNLAMEKTVAEKLKCKNIENLEKKASRPPRTPASKKNLRKISDLTPQFFIGKNECLLSISHQRDAKEAVSKIDLPLKSGSNAQSTKSNPISACDMGVSVSNLNSKHESTERKCQKYNSGIKLLESTTSVSTGNETKFAAISINQQSYDFLDQNLENERQCLAPDNTERCKKKLKYSPKDTKLSTSSTKCLHTTQHVRNISINTRAISRVKLFDDKITTSLNHMTPNAQQSPRPSSSRNLFPMEQREELLLPSQDTVKQIPDESQNILSENDQVWCDLIEFAKRKDDKDSDRNLNTKQSDVIIKSSAKLCSAKKSMRADSLSPKKTSIFRRRRLIDSLVEQSSNFTLQGHLSEESEAESDASSIFDSAFNIDEPSNDSFESTQTESQVVFSDKKSLSSSQVTESRFTYSRQRSMLAEEDPMKDLIIDFPLAHNSSNPKKNRRGSIPKLQPISGFEEEEDDDDDENSQTFTKNVHELRKSGANKRFVDQCTDFLDRIGSPSSVNRSIRRSGLLDLAYKMMDKNFAQQLRVNSIEQQLFVHLDTETDIISGFLMMSILISILTEGPIPHLISHLCLQGITKLMIYLMNCELEIAIVCKERKTNLSKSVQSLILQHHADLLQSAVWGELEPVALSTRIVALKCLEMMVIQTRETNSANKIFCDTLTTTLFTMLRSASYDETSSHLKTLKSTEFSLIVAIIQAYSTLASPILDESTWIREYIPIIADVLEISISRLPALLGTHLLLLKITLQVTNNNQTASDIFARPSLILRISKTIVSQFDAIYSQLTSEKFLETVDHLSLLLGILMNFSEWSSRTRDCLQGFQHQEKDPLESMLLIFEEQSENISQAESEQETLKNVLLGYLAVTLGFLSQHPMIDARSLALKSKLICCIEEFISIHRLADLKMAENKDSSPDELEENGLQVEGQTELTERLERLICRLKLE